MKLKACVLDAYKHKNSILCVNLILVSVECRPWKEKSGADFCDAARRTPFLIGR
jgi:hypothetical protein